MEVSDLYRATICQVTEMIGQSFLLHSPSEDASAFSNIHLCTSSKGQQDKSLLLR